MLAPTGLHWDRLAGIATFGCKLAMRLSFWLSGWALNILFVYILAPVPPSIDGLLSQLPIERTHDMEICMYRWAMQLVQGQLPCDLLTSCVPDYAAWSVQ